MTVRLVVTATGGVAFSGSGYGPEGAVQCERGRPIDDALRPKLACALTIATANNATLQEHEGRWWVHGDPTEAALIVAARKAGLKGDVLDARFTRRAELPFSSERRLMSTIDVDAEHPGRLFAFTKAARRAPASLRVRVDCRGVEAVDRRPPHPHVAKHTAGTLLAAGNVNVHLIRQRLGHRSLASSAIYCQGISDQQAAQAARSVFAATF
jgi:integrase